MSIETVRDWQARNAGGVEGTDCVAWHAGLDYLGTLLRANTAVTPYGAPNQEMAQQWREGYLEEVRKAVEQYSESNLEAFADVTEEVLSRPRKRVRDIRDFEGDDLCVESYLESEHPEEEKIFLSEHKEEARRKPALNIIIPVDVPGGHTRLTYIRDAQRSAYRTCLLAEQDRRPVRVVGVYSAQYRAMSGRTLTQYIVIKDWEDPVFPALWGCFQDNRIANLVSCLNSLFILGSTESGLGSVTSRAVRQDFTDGEEIVLAHGNSPFITLD
jgi:hypothetical protein